MSTTNRKTVYLILFLLIGIMSGCEKEETSKEQEPTQPEYIYSSGGIWNGTLLNSSQTFKFTFTANGALEISNVYYDDFHRAYTRVTTYASWGIISETDTYFLKANNGTFVDHDGRTLKNQNDSYPFIKNSDTNLSLDYYSNGFNLSLIKSN